MAGPKLLPAAMSRIIRYDLLLGLVGFALGAAGLSMAGLAEAAPSTPSGETNLVAQADVARPATPFREVGARAIG